MAGLFVMNHVQLCQLKSLVGAACPRRGLHRAREEKRDRRDRQQSADDGEGVAEAHDQRLTADRGADRRNRLVLRRERDRSRRAP